MSRTPGRFALALAVPALALLLALPAMAQSPRLGRPVQIEADRLVASARSSEAVFEGNVRVRQDAWTLTARQLRVTYGERRRVRTLVAEGDVRVVEGDRVVTAARATLDNQRRTLRLTGEPVLTQGDNVVRGEVVVLDLDTSNLTVEAVRADVRLRDVMRAAEPSNARGADGEASQ